MRFIMVKTPDITEYNGSIRPGESVAVNVGKISSIKIVSGEVCLELSGNTLVSTQFTSIEAAVDFIQRAPSMSMGVS
jgi:translation elongation factor EF-1alpha